MFCRKCGLEIPDDSFFCPKCGEQTSPSIDQHQAPDTQQKQSASLPIENKTPPPNPKQEILQVTKSPYTIKERILFLFKFSGRITRKEFIINLLVVIAIQFVLGFIIGMVGEGTSSTIAVIGIFLALIPQLSLTVRRMRDAGLPLFLIPLLFVFLVFCSIQTHNYRQQFVFIQKNQSDRTHKPDKKLKSEALSYLNTAENYKTAGMITPLLSLGMLAALPSRKRKD